MTEKVIELVKCHRILYDLEHEDYKNIRKKDRIWDEIGAELEESGETVKKRWKNIRDTYGKYLRSIKSRTGQSAVQKLRKWQWASQMEPFRPFMSFTKNEPNIINSMEDNEPEFQNITIEDNDFADLIAEEEDSTFTSPSTEDIFVSESKKRKKVKRAVCDSPVSTDIDYLHANRNEKNHPIDLIFSGYAETVKLFCMPMQIAAKKKIAQLMWELEIENAKRNPSTPFVQPSRIFRAVETRTKFEP